VFQFCKQPLEVGENIRDERGLPRIFGGRRPRKCNQDGLDACLCLLVALYLAERKDCLMVGDRQTGYIVVPYGPKLRAELDSAGVFKGRLHPTWRRARHRATRHKAP
jgi:predicted RNase H-like nuclease